MKTRPVPTEYLPAERSSAEELSQHQRLVRSAQLLDKVPTIAFMLNPCRQVVAYNDALRAFLDLPDDGHVLGSRPGDLFDCVHARESEGGCGTTLFCTTCGAARAIDAGLRGESEVQECRITRKADGSALDLRVWATPVEVGGVSLVALAMSDIADEKRREVLEQVFFHDVLNTAGGVFGYAQLLELVSPDERAELQKRLLAATRRLITEIEAQRGLVDLEKGAVEPELSRLSTGAVFREAQQTLEGHRVCVSKTITIDPEAEECSFESDPILLGRVLVNLLKNALEATDPGGGVTLAARSDPDGLHLTVHNAGTMPLDVQLQVFQRSFSTKGPGRGLGTYSAKLLTERHLGGRVSFASTPQAGTTFTLRLPLAPRSPEVRAR